MSKIFLKAEWRKLAMANYAVDEDLFLPYLPPKTEIDIWNNTCYLSLVGFMFMNTRLKGIKIPFHTNFEEVNLRFYVRYREDKTWKRGVVFIKEIVPKPALSLIANWFYKENYETLPMKHFWENKNDTLSIEYRWKKGIWNSFKVEAEKDPSKIIVGSEEEFITEHYWGYTKLNDNSTSEYKVEHPIWDVYKIREFTIDVDFGAVYGRQFDFLQSIQPLSVFLAEGSEVIVKKNQKI